MRTEAPLHMTSTSTSPLQAWRTSVLNVLLTIAAIATLPVLGYVFLQAFQIPGQWPAAAAFTLCYLLVAVLTLGRRLDVRVRAWGFLLVVYAVGTLALARGGLAGDGRTYLLALPVLAVILIGVRSGLVMTAISLTTYAVFAALAHLGQLGPWLLRSDNPLNLEEWIAVGAVMAVAMALFMVLLWQFVRFQQNILDAERAQAAELAQTTQLLQERAVELEKTNTLLAERTELLTFTAQVMEHISSLTDEQSIMERFVHLVAERLDIYHVGLFLREPQEAFAVLRAASSDAGQKMVQQGYRVQVGSDDPVSQALRGAIGTLASVVPGSISPLPQTRWRIALPLQVRGKTIGVLDLQFSSEAPPSQERLETLRMLAGQLAISLDNARLFQQAQESLEAERQARGELSREAWAELLRTQPRLGFIRNRSGLAPADGSRPTMQMTLRTGPTTPGDSSANRLAVPIQVRGQVIGMIEARKPQGAWARDEIALVETLTEQLGVALESARLYQDTQRRAMREQLVGEVATRVRESLDIESVLKTAAEQIRQSLGMQQVTVQLASEEALHPVGP